MHDMHRFPRGQDCVSSCRLGQGAQEAAGKRLGTAGTKLGNASLTWAFSAAAVLCWRKHPAGQRHLTRLEQKHGKGQARTLRAHRLARAVSDRLKRHTALDPE